MSIQFLNGVWNLSEQEILTDKEVAQQRNGDRKPLVPKYKIVLLALADHADDNGLCWPSCKTLAKKTGYCERQVRRILNSLEQRGLITRKDRVRGKVDQCVLNVPTCLPTEDKCPDKPGKTVAVKKTAYTKKRKRNEPSDDHKPHRKTILEIDESRQLEAVV